MKKKKQRNVVILLSAINCAIKANEFDLAIKIIHELEENYKLNVVQTSELERIKKEIDENEEF